MTRVQPSFWKSIDDHNRSTERRIGRLKKLITKKIRDEPTQLSILICFCVLISVTMKIGEFKVTIKACKLYWFHCVCKL